MNVIVLTGSSHSGKTTTLKIVYEYLKGINQQETNRFRYLDPAQKDFFDVLIIQGVVVVIFTQGDYIRQGSGHPSVFSLLDNAVKEKAQIVLCPFSTHNDKSYLLKINKYAQKTLSVEKDERDEGYEQGDANHKDADKVIALFKDMLNEIQNESK